MLKCQSAKVPTWRSGVERSKVKHLPYRNKVLNKVKVKELEPGRARRNVLDVADTPRSPLIDAVTAVLCT